VRVLHAIHDFLPRHQAGSEIYCHTLCRALQERGTAVHVLAAEYDPAEAHGRLRWRVHDGVGVTEVINNWRFASFAESHSSPALGQRLAQVLDIVQPDVLHIHNLLNLSLDLPRLARGRGIPVVATLHDYTLVCPTGGQRVHVAEQHLCREIDTARCARCFAGSHFGAQLRFGAVVGRPGGLLAARALGAVRRAWPGAFTTLGRAAAATGATITAADIEQRLARARQVFDTVDCFVSPSPSLAAEFRALGLPEGKLEVLDYGFQPRAARAARPPRGGRPLRIGFVGTLVWHKGAHVLLDAARSLPAGSCEVLLFGDPAIFPDYTADLRRRAARLPVEFRGGFARGDAAAVYDAIDVLVVPSLWLENSPLVIHEAFQAGVPVVGSRLGGTADLLRDGVDGLLYEAFSADDLAAALARLIDEPGLLERLAAAAPPVRAIADDARFWEERYAALLGERRSA